jgi:hypothetical protein
MRTLFKAYSAEVHFVTQLLRETMSQAHILSVQRVENGPQHDAFLRRRRSLIAELATSGIAWSEESHARWAFHGTADAAVDQIVRPGSPGLDCTSIARLGNGSRLGRGAHLSPAADLANRCARAPPAAPLLRRVVLCRALVGRTWKGGEDLRGPPLGWHSLTDRPQSPSVFALPHSAQACPSFVVAYTVPAPPRDMGPGSGPRAPPLYRDLRVLREPRQHEDVHAALLRVVRRRAPG